MACCVCPIASIIWTNWSESGGMNGSASGTVASTLRNSSSDVPLAAGRCEEKIWLGYKWRTRSNTSPNMSRSAT